MIKSMIIGPTLALVMLFVGSQMTGTWDEYFAQKNLERIETSSKPELQPKKCNFSEPNKPFYNGRCTWAGQPLD